MQRYHFECCFIVQSHQPVAGADHANQVALVPGNRQFPARRRDHPGCSHVRGKQGRLPERSKTLDLTASRTAHREIAKIDVDGQLQTGFVESAGEVLVEHARLDRNAIVFNSHYAVEFPHIH